MIPGFPKEFTSDARVRFTRFVCGAWTVDEALAEEQAQWWIESLRPDGILYPRAVVDVLADELLHFSFAEVSSVDVHKGSVTVDLTGMDGAQLATLAGCTVVLAEARTRLNIDLAGVEPPYRRQGFAGRLLYNIYRLAVALDITRVSLKAKLEDGPYVWPRFGFVPDEQDWEAAKPKIRAA
jgi:GNAT superfamily N-acetyltransferase